jgi:hypothetical protein
VLSESLLGLVNGAFKQPLADHILLVGRYSLFGRGIVTPVLVDTIFQLDDSLEAWLDWQ